MLLKAVCNLHKLLIALGKILFQSGDGLGCADTRHHVLALRIDQVLAVNAFGAGRRISRKGNACARCIAHVAKYHRLHVYRRAPVTGYIVHTSVYNRPLVIPGTEHRFHRFHKLYSGILRELFAFVFFVNIFETDDDLFHVLSGQVGVVLHALGLFDFV